MNKDDILDIFYTILVLLILLSPMIITILFIRKDYNDCRDLGGNYSNGYCMSKEYFIERKGGNHKDG